jgi:hypothetical protein
MEKHTQNIQIYLSSGGDPKLALRYKTPTLENRAKISYLISQLPTVVISNSPRDPEKSPITSPGLKIEKSKPAEKFKRERPKFIGVIAQYPSELHKTYQEVDSLWFEFCEMKLELNSFPADQEADAYEVQMEILEVMKKFDKHKYILDYYLEHKRVLPMKSKNDFSNLNIVQLDHKYKNLESLICRRKQTIVKMQNELPPDDDQNYRKKAAAVQRKIEQLQEYILDQEKIQDLLAD